MRQSVFLILTAFLLASVFLVPGKDLFAQGGETKTLRSLMNQKKVRPSKREIKKKKERNNKIANDNSGNTVAHVDKKYNLRSKNLQSSSFEPQEVTFPGEKKKLTKKANEIVTKDQSGNTVAHVDKKYQIRSKSFQASGYEPGTTTHPTEKKKLEKRPTKSSPKIKAGIP